MRSAMIKRAIHGIEHYAYVEDIEVGKRTMERVYRIRYMDGGMQHMTEQAASQGTPSDGRGGR